LQQWTKPLFEAFCAGAWILYWTDDTLYWIAKPRVHCENRTSDWYGRLHNDTGPAVESDLEPWYFVHGVMVDAYIVEHPESITCAKIDQERNVEVRRIMIDRYGQARYLQDSGAKLIHSDDWGVLYRTEIKSDEPLVMVKVVNSTPEGHDEDTGEMEDYEVTLEEYAAEITYLIEDGCPTSDLEKAIKPGIYQRPKLRFVPDLDEHGSEIRKDYFLRVPPTCTTALEAVAWTFNQTPEQYATLAAQT
jgi:hypothetical protein